MRLAKYSSTCIVCKKRIVPEEPIVRVFPFWVHSECAKRIDVEGLKNV